MKLLAIENSRLTALFQIARIRGQLFLPDAALMLASRYNFSNYPRAYQELSADKIEFKHALFQETAIESLEIYSDGVVISASSDTDIIDSFFGDLCKWLEDELSLSFIKTHSVDRIYETTIVFQTEKNVLDPLGTLSELADSIQLGLKDNSGLTVKYEPFGWALSSDQTQNPALKSTTFRIERRVGSEFALQQFISVAPLKTKQHLALIEQLESLV
jgi:hypothetical protein